jgi:hypothetical protein
MMGGMETVLHVVTVALAAVAVYGLLEHVRRGHRRLRLHRPAFDPERSHAFAPSTDDEHLCSCGRALAHDVHHRIGGVG